MSKLVRGCVVDINAGDAARASPPLRLHGCVVALLVKSTGESEEADASASRGVAKHPWSSGYDVSLTR